VISYEGRPTWKTTRGGATVVGVEDGIEWTLDPRLDLCNHSPTGFAWGYSGSGPAQTSLAILADWFGKQTDAEVDRILGVLRIEHLESPPTLEHRSWREYLAICLHQSFKARVIACFENNERFSLTSDEVAAHVLTIAEASGKAGRWA